MNFLNVRLTDGTILKFRVIKVLTNGFFLTKPNRDPYRKHGIPHMYQITHASGNRLLAGKDPVALEQFCASVLANPVIQTALTEMSVLGDDMLAANQVWHNALPLLPQKIRDGFTAFAAEVRD
jgi:hypothetical protein